MVVYAALYLSAISVQIVFHSFSALYRVRRVPLCLRRRVPASRSPAVACPASRSFACRHACRLALLCPRPLSLSPSLCLVGGRYPMVFTRWRRNAWNGTHGAEEHPFQQHCIPSSIPSKGAKPGLSSAKLNRPISKSENQFSKRKQIFQNRVGNGR